MPDKIYTIGYEGRTQDALITTLTYAGIEVVIDVRNRTYRGDAGFGPDLLSAGLARYGIDYVCLEGGIADRRAEPDGLCSAAFGAICGCAAPCEDAAVRVHDIAGTRRACLLCYEFHPEDQCHRGRLAHQVADARGFAVEHLYIWPDMPVTRIHFDIPRELPVIPTPPLTPPPPV